MKGNKDKLKKHKRKNVKKKKQDKDEQNQLQKCLTMKKAAKAKSIVVINNLKRLSLNILKNGV